MTAALLLVAVAAALRGTWSPCGLSMLSTLTPVAERARGRRFAPTACYFVAGAVLGGALLGGACAAAASVLHASSLPAPARLAVAFVATVVTLAADARIGGLRLPDHPRQVDETWVQRFRPWVYAGGFGLQLGVGLATYVMTNATYALVAGAALLVAPRTAFVVCVAFGLCRGLTVLLGAWASSPARLRAVHRALGRLDRASLGVAMGAQLVLAVAVLAAAGGAPTHVLGALVVAALALACALRLRRTTTEMAVGT